MVVCIDETGQDDLACAIDDSGILRNIEVTTNASNDVSSNQDIRVLQRCNLVSGTDIVAEHGAMLKEYCR